MIFFSNSGKRRAWFDTTATAHALDDPCYVVEPRPLGAKLVPNGLPVFTLNYVNDDDGERELGTDSRLLFTAPADAKYLARVTDTRGMGGDLVLGGQGIVAGWDYDKYHSPRFFLG